MKAKSWPSKGVEAISQTSVAEGLVDLEILWKYFEPDAKRRKSHAPSILKEISLTQFRLGDLRGLKNGVSIYSELNKWYKPHADMFLCALIDIANKLSDFPEKCMASLTVTQGLKKSFLSWIDSRQDNMVWDSQKERYKITIE